MPQPGTGALSLLIPDGLPFTDTPSMAIWVDLIHDTGALSLLIPDGLTFTDIPLWRYG